MHKTKLNITLTETTLRGRATNPRLNPISRAVRKATGVEDAILNQTGTAVWLTAPHMRRPRKVALSTTGKRIVKRVLTDKTRITPGTNFSLTVPTLVLKG